MCIRDRFKDECNGRVIAELVALRPKMNSILEVSGACTKKAKGVQRITVKKDLKHEMYKQTLFRREEMKHTQVVIRKSRSQDRSLRAKQDVTQSNGHQKVDRCRRHYDVRIRA